ncbi:MAG: family 43 glycosylhydrolase [Chitinophagaceae bacterium]
MKRQIILLILLVSIFNLAFSQNPIIKHIYTADPAAHVFKDTLFVYTSHDEDTATWFNMKNWHVFSTTDMKNWTDHGAVFSLSDLSWAKRSAWAPDCAYANGQYYFYFPVETNSIGVAISFSPQGKFKDALDKSLISRQTPGVVCSGYLIDPTVFIDDDSSTYLLFGMNDLNIVKLNRDMFSFSDTVRQIKGADNFFEAVWLHKYKGRYYLSYSGQFDSTGAGKLLYAVADSPYGPYKYRGVLLDEMNSGTNHHSIVQYKGDWYLFYHNSDLYYSQHPEEKPVVNWGSKSPFRRSVCVDRLYYTEDGTIRKVIPAKAGVSVGR